MKKIISLAVIILVVISLCSCGNSVDKKTESKQEGTILKNGDLVINTPYADLKLPGVYVGKISYEVSEKDPFTVSFKYKNDGFEIFSFVFGSKGDILIGTLKGKKSTVLYLNVTKTDPESEEYSEYREFQEAPYEIIDRLKQDYEFVSNEDALNEDNGETFDIKTSVVTLKYPEKWKDKADIAVTDDSVTIMRNGQQVIKLFFSGEEGYLLGEYNGTPIRITTYSGDDKELAAMRDDGDVMMDNLINDPAFKKASQTTSE